MYICTQFILVTHMPMKLKRKKSDGRLQNEKTIRQVVMRFDKKNITQNVIHSMIF